VHAIQPEQVWPVRNSEMTRKTLDSATLVHSMLTERHPGWPMCQKSNLELVSPFVGGRGNVDQWQMGCHSLYPMV
jgi:hypothetical protein